MQKDDLSIPAGQARPPILSAKYPHYYKPCPYTHIDIYRVLELFSVTDPCIAHAVKKMLVAGGRGSKDFEKDVQEAISSLERWVDMRREEKEKSDKTSRVNYRE